MPIEFTQSELQTILADLSFPSGQYDLDALLAAIGDSIDVDALEAGLFTGAASPEALAAATANATRQARQIATNLAKSELSSLAEKVRQNIADGNAFDKLAGKLSEIAGLDKNRAATLAKHKEALIRQGVTGEELVNKVERMRAKLLRDRRRTIAQTEQRMATESGAFEVAKSRGSKFKRWITAGDSKVSDIDVSNEGQGWVDIDSNFSSGDVHPPSHPGCRCTLTYRTFPPSEFDEARAQQASEETQAAKAEGTS